MDTINVKPATDLKVRDPEHGMKHLPAAGRRVPQTPYWMRRLRDGDVVRADVDENAAASSKPAAVDAKDKKASAK